MTIGQDVSQKNAIYGSGGYINYMSQYSLAYERTVFQKSKFEISTKVVIGNYHDEAQDYAGNYIDYFGGVSAVLLYSIIEFDAGVTVPIYESSGGAYGGYNGPTRSPAARSPILPDLDLGLRIPVNRIIFRAGVGFPELIYFSSGFRF